MAIKRQEKLGGSFGKEPFEGHVSEWLQLKSQDEEAQALTYQDLLGINWDLYCRTQGRPSRGEPHLPLFALGAMQIPVAPESSVYISLAEQIEILRRV